MSNTIDLIDVKQLWDAAYDEKGKARVNIRRFRKLYKKAAKLDAAYRRQLAGKAPFEFRGAA